MKHAGGFVELTGAQIIERLGALNELANGGPGGVAFDADGTLWSGDAGEEALIHAVEQGLIREEAGPALRREASEFGVPCDDTPSGIARRLLEGFRRGTYPELRACEMMVWCYAGFSEALLREHTRQALTRAASKVQLYDPLVPLIEWCRRQGLRCIVISASPKLVVEEAARPLGFEPRDILAGRALVREGRIQAALAEAIPYAAEKAKAGRALLGDLPWLAAFGDNAFDLDMLKAANLAVAVRPRRRLLDVLSEVQGAVVFREG